MLTRWRSEALDTTLCPSPRAGRTMQGTILCWVNDTDHGRAALQAAADLSDRLKLRLVLAHVADGVHGTGENGSTRTHNRRDAARLVARLASEHGLSDRAERRSAVGDPAALLGQIAAEEAADLIVVGAPAGGRLRRSSESRLAERPRERDAGARPDRAAAQAALASLADETMPALTSTDAVCRSSGVSSRSTRGSSAGSQCFCLSPRSRSMRRSRTTQALIVVAGLAITLVTNALLLRRAFAPLERLAQRMETVDLLRPGQRLPVGSDDEVGRVVAAFNQMLDRLESERQRERPPRARRAGGRADRDRPRPARRGRPAADGRAARS